MKYTLEDQITRIWDIEKIKDLMGRRAYYHDNDDREQVLDRLWVSMPEHRVTASYGRNQGYLVGMERIRSYYLDSTLREGRYAEGCMNMHPISTPLIELAEDGRSARGLWYVIGQETSTRPGQLPQANWISELLAVDFLKEDGVWKIWHLFTERDLECEAGQAYSDQAVFIPPEEEPSAVGFYPDVSMLAHDVTFNWWDNYPPIPVPYKTITPENSYGPEGHPHYQEAIKNEE